LWDGFGIEQCRWLVAHDAPLEATATPGKDWLPIRNERSRREWSKGLAAAGWVELAIVETGSWSEHSCSEWPEGRR